MNFQGLFLGEKNFCLREIQIILFFGIISRVYSFEDTLIIQIVTNKYQDQRV